MIEHGKEIATRTKGHDHLIMRQCINLPILSQTFYCKKKQKKGFETLILLFFLPIVASERAVIKTAKKSNLLRRSLTQTACWKRIEME
jgi:hypothetical protein